MGHVFETFHYSTDLKIAFCVIFCVTISVISLKNIFWVNLKLLACVSNLDLPVGEYLKANETFSTFLLTNGNLSSATVDQLLKARLNLQVISPPLDFIVCQPEVLTQSLSISSSKTKSMQYMK